MPPPIQVENNSKSGAGMSIEDRAKVIFQVRIYETQHTQENSHRFFHSVLPSQKLDVDNDGEITMEEFVEGYIRMHNPGGPVASSSSSSSASVLASSAAASSSSSSATAAAEDEGEEDGAGGEQAQPGHRGL